MSCVLLALASLLTAPSVIAAQTLPGLVRDAGNSEPVVGATVTQADAEGVLHTTVTDAAGRFELELAGEPPFEITVERLGYEVAGVSVADSVLEGDDRLVIRLTPKPAVLAGLEAEVEREEVDFYVPGFGRVTEDGVLSRGSPGCYYIVLDSVVMNHPRYFRPDALEYEPARQVVSPGGIYRGWRPHQIDDPRLRRDAYPCGVGVLRRHRDADRIFGPPPLPEPDAPAFAFVEEAAFDLPAAVRLRPAAHTLAPAPDGRLAAASANAPAVLLFSPDGHSRETIDLRGPPLDLRSVTRVGWLADTLWAADAVSGRIAFLPPPGGGPFRVRNDSVALAAVRPGGMDTTTAGWAATDPPTALDLAVPVPLAGNRWLWSVPAADPPYPAVPEDMPPGRLLLGLDDDWRLVRVLAALRPPPERMDMDGAGTPPVDPLRDHPLVAVSPDGAHVTIVRREHAMARWMSIYTVTRIDAAGDTIFHVERAAPLVRAEGEVLEAVAARMADHPALVRAVRSAPARRLVARAGLYEATYLPPIMDVAVGRDGTTWLRWPDTDEESVRWNVLDGAGRPLRTLETDPRLRILDANGETVWGGIVGQRGGGDAGAGRVVRYTLVSAG